MFFIGKFKKVLKIREWNCIYNIGEKKLLWFLEKFSYYIVERNKTEKDLLENHDIPSTILVILIRLIILTYSF